MESSAGKIWACLAAIDRLGNVSSAVCIAQMVYPFGSLTVRPWAGGRLWSQGVSIPRNWLVQPDSVIAREAPSRLSGTTGKVVRLL